MIEGPAESDRYVKMGGVQRITRLLYYGIAIESRSPIRKCFPNDSCTTLCVYSRCCLCCWRCVCVSLSVGSVFSYTQLYSTSTVHVHGIPVGAWYERLVGDCGGM